MVLLGLLLFAASVAAAISIAISNTESTSFDVFGQTITTLSPGGLMLLGVALGVAATLGLWLIAAGARHRQRRREAERQAALHARSRVDELEEENVRLRHVVERRESAVEPEPLPSSGGLGTHEQAEFGGDRTDTNPLGTDRTGTERTGTERTGTERTGTDKTSEPTVVRLDDPPHGYPAPAYFPDPDQTAHRQTDQTVGHRDQALGQRDQLGQQENRVFGRPQ